MPTMRRVIARGDYGIDVLIAQHALNSLLTFQKGPLPHPIADWRRLHQRKYPGLEGYVWSHCAMEQYARTRPDRVHVGTLLPALPQMRLIWATQILKPRFPVSENGHFDADTEAAVMRLQAMLGLPTDGIIGPELWDYLVPWWDTYVWLPIKGVRPPASTIPDAPQEPPQEIQDAAASAPEENVTKFDNVEAQTGFQRDQSGRIFWVLVGQGTFKFARGPNERVPGHWEVTSGGQLNLPLDYQYGGKNLQVYVQLTRADFWIKQFAEVWKLTLFAPFLQPQVQVPLDKGSLTSPNLVQLGVNVGTTVSLERKINEDLTIKIGVQVSGGRAIDTKGHASWQGGVFSYIDFQFDADALLRLFKKKKQPATPRRGARRLSLQVEPKTVVVRPNDSAELKVSVDRQGFDGPIRVDLGELPPGAMSPGGMIYTDYDSTRINIYADANATPVVKNQVYAVATDGSHWDRSTSIGDSDYFTVRVQ
jgi:peptidoglycan hydrolase-like protein with peptidoglycan-binding domain